MMVVDRIGSLVGGVVGLTFDGSQRVLANVVLQKDGRMVALIVYPDHFEGTGPSLSYESPNCTGTPLVDGDFTTLILPSTIEGLGNTVYLPDTSAPLLRPSRSPRTPCSSSARVFRCRAGSAFNRPSRRFPW